MATIRIEFATDNAAFEYSGEVRRVLQVATALLHDDWDCESRPVPWQRALRDSNGNTVGTVEVID
jgi:hypothetical protein